MLIYSRCWSLNLQATQNFSLTLFDMFPFVKTKTNKINFIDDSFTTGYVSADLVKQFTWAAYTDFGSVEDQSDKVFLWKTISDTNIERWYNKFW